MSDKNSHELAKDSTQDLFKHINQQHPVRQQQSQQNLRHDSVGMNPHGIFLTHEQKIQATYNFQSLFRKKSHIYNLHKNKKKLLNKNTKNESLKTEQTDKQSKNVKKGHWTTEQNRKYHWFLQLHNKHFILKHLRRTDKIFKTMSSFIGSRQAQQCRSHHQKMQKKYRNFYQIIIKLRMQYYGTCGVELLGNDLQENGYGKGGQVGLIDEHTLRAMQNVKQQQQGNNINDNNNNCSDDDHIEGVKIQHMNQIMPIHDDGHQQKSMEQEHLENNNNKEKHQGSFFFAQNYEKQLNNYKLY